MASDPQPERDSAEQTERSYEDASSRRFEQQVLWVDAQIRDVMARGEFDNLPGAGKPIEGLDGTYDPEWWVKGVIQREKITGLGPPAILLRTEDAELDTRLDRESAESEVRRILDDFNARVRRARLQLTGGPPVVTKTRDVDAEVDAWRSRRDARRAENLRRAADERQRGTIAPPPAVGRRHWWNRSR